MAGCLSVAEVHQALGLDALKNRTFQIFKTSATKGEGLDRSSNGLVVECVAKQKMINIAKKFFYANFIEKTSRTTVTWNDPRRAGCIITVYLL